VNRFAHVAPGAFARGAQSARFRRGAFGSIKSLPGQGLTRSSKSAILLLVFLLSLMLSITGWAQDVTPVRVGAFPNITHAQAMVGKANGWFDKAMGPKVKVQWTSFNAGPAAIEALFAGAIDMTYVGPNPAINGYVRSNGEALRVVAGVLANGFGDGRRELSAQQPRQPRSLRHGCQQNVVGSTDEAVHAGAFQRYCDALGNGC